MAIIFVWVSRELFHIAWNAVYAVWLKNPNASIGIAHPIGDANFGFPIIYAYSSPVLREGGILSYSGIYNWLYYTGFFSLVDLYNFVIMCELLGVISIPLAKGGYIFPGSSTQWASLIRAASSFDLATLGPSNWEPPGYLELVAIFIWPPKFFVAYEDSYCLRLNFHLGIIIGFLSASWGGHLVLASSGLGMSGAKQVAFYTGDWVLYSIINELTCLGGLKSNRLQRT